MANAFANKEVLVWEELDRASLPKELQTKIGALIDALHDVKAQKDELRQAFYRATKLYPAETHRLALPGFSQRGDVTVKVSVAPFTNTKKPTAKFG